MSGVNSFLCVVLCLAPFSGRFGAVGPFARCARVEVPPNGGPVVLCGSVGRGAACSW